MRNILDKVLRTCKCTKIELNILHIWIQPRFYACGRWFDVVPDCSRTAKFSFTLMADYGKYWHQLSHMPNSTHLEVLDIIFIRLTLSYFEQLDKNGKLHEFNITITVHCSQPRFWLIIHLISMNSTTGASSPTFLNSVSVDNWFFLNFSYKGNT